MKSKISGTGWYCVLHKDGHWIPVFKLTETQLSMLNDAKVQLDESWLKP